MARVLGFGALFVYGEARGPEARAIWCSEIKVYRIARFLASIKSTVTIPMQGYAGKYCSKPERYFFMESEKNGVKCWLKARTVGLCATFNRLLHYHCVRRS